jgi:hypothetical protein
MLAALASTLAARDPSTAAHCTRVTFHAGRLAAWIGWDDPRLRTLAIGGPLHDSGERDTRRGAVARGRQCVRRDDFHAAVSPCPSGLPCARGDRAVCRLAVRSHLRFPLSRSVGVRRPPRRRRRLRRASPTLTGVRPGRKRAALRRALAKRGTCEDNVCSRLSRSDLRTRRGPEVKRAQPLKRRPD